MFNMPLTFFLLLFISNLAYADYDKEMAALRKDMPKRVIKFIDRQIECNHWGGEEPYGEERLREINAATDRFNCNDLGKDEIKLKKRYKLKPNIIQRINKAKEFY